MLPTQLRTACVGFVSADDSRMGDTAEGISENTSPSPNQASITVGPGEQTAGKAAKTSVQVEQQQCNDTQISVQEADRQAAAANAPADDHAVDHPTAHVALLQQQVIVILSAATGTPRRSACFVTGCAVLLRTVLSACLLLLTGMVDSCEFLN